MIHQKVSLLIMFPHQAGEIEFMKCMLVYLKHFQWIPIYSDPEGDNLTGKNLAHQ